MKFSDDPGLEALIGKVCLVFARVEQEAGHAIAAAHGNFGVAMSQDYLMYSSNSRRLLKWLKAVARAYPEVAAETSTLEFDLDGLKQQRDEWAHSAAIIDLWLMMEEKSLTAMSDHDVERRSLLNGRQAGHISAPTQADVNAFVQRASDIGDAATALAHTLDELTQLGVRPVEAPR